MHLMVLGASRHGDRNCYRHLAGVSMRLMVLGVSRLGCLTTTFFLRGLNAPGGAGCFPNPRRVVRCPAWGNGLPIATGPKAPLGPGRTQLIEPDFAQFSQGSPPTGLPGLRATRCRRGHADPGVRAVFFRYQRAGAGHGPGGLGPSAAGRRRASSQGWAPQVLPVGEATSVLPQGSWWPGTVGVVRC